MEIGIIGLPNSGKTTVFNAVTKGSATVATHGTRANIGVARVPDQRLTKLAQMFNPKKVVPAEVTYTDVPAPPDGFGQTRGIGGEYLNVLQACDALLLVIRSFANPAVPHIEETIDGIRDLENMLLEINFADLEILERRLTRLSSNVKGAKPAEKENLKSEAKMLETIKSGLEEGLALRTQSLTESEKKQLSGFGFLSSKPLIIVMNIGEEDLALIDAKQSELATGSCGPNLKTIVICAQLEMELGQMPPEAELEFRKDFGTIESSLDKMINVSYDVTDQISFFTVGEDEVRAWQVLRNTGAQKSAGRIHSDLERGFIRAEVVSCNDLLDAGGLIGARKLGLLRQEGKEYVVKDGDIMHVLFNL